MKKVIKGKMFDVGLRGLTQPTVYIYKQIKHLCFKYDGKVIAYPS